MMLMRMVLWLVGLWLALAWIAVSALMLGACTHPTPLTPAQVDALAAAEQGWRRAGLPDPGDCLRGLEVRHGSCGTPANSCLLHEGHWVVVIDEAATDRPAIVHEAMHALYACTLPRLHWSDPYDARHTDRRVWAPEAGSAEVLAR